VGDLPLKAAQAITLALRSDAGNVRGLPRPWAAACKLPWLDKFKAEFTAEDASEIFQNKQKEQSRVT